MKKKLLVITVLSSLFLTACGEKNTITYDKKTDKLTFSEFDTNLQGVKYAINNYDILRTGINKWCSNETATLADKELKEKGSAILKDCNGVTIKLINFK